MPALAGTSTTRSPRFSRPSASAMTIAAGMLADTRLPSFGNTSLYTLPFRIPAALPARR